MDVDLQFFNSSQGPVSYRKIGHGERKIVFFHGFPGTSQQILLFKNLATIENLEVICMDRIGYNNTLSNNDDKTILNNNPPASLDGRSLQRINEIILTELIKSKNWEKFELVCISGGTPFGISFLIQNFSKIIKTTVICGLGDLSLEGIKEHFPIISKIILKVLPFVSSKLIKTLFTPKENSSKSVNPMLNYFMPTSEADIATIQNSKLKKILDNGLLEALDNKCLGIKSDAKVFLTPWCCGCEDLNSKITFWHGSEDKIIDYHHSLVMSKLFKNSETHIIPGEGHISLPLKYLHKALKN